MINGPTRFNLYLDKLETLLAEADKQPDAALWLYQNGTRTPLFMLEGLAKLYGGIHNKKRFAKIEKHFKLLEDGIGAIDYYDAFAKEFETTSSVPDEVTKAVRARCDEKLRSLNDLLRAKKWIGTEAKRLGKIKKKLEKTEWLNDKDEITAIEAFYGTAIKKINDFARVYEAGFTELENEVHELRRRLRWLSIYPQALQGCVQLSEAPSNDIVVTKYLTSDVVNSPYNKMPDAGENQYLLMLNRNYFFALSWMIAELGKLKDEGLRIAVLKEAGNNSESDGSDEESILNKASEICRTFFAEKNLDKLILGTKELSTT